MTQMDQRAASDAMGHVAEVATMTRAMAVGVDLGRRVAHYVVIAWGEDFAGLVIDYGRFDVASDEPGAERAMATG